MAIASNQRGDLQDDNITLNGEGRELSNRN
jgi:hypothetical protein